MESFAFGRTTPRRCVGGGRALKQHCARCASSALMSPSFAYGACVPCLLRGWLRQRAHGCDALPPAQGGLTMNRQFVANSRRLRPWPAVRRPCGRHVGRGGKPRNRRRSNWQGQRVWLIGASSGIGAALAARLYWRRAHRLRCRRARTRCGTSPTQRATPRKLGHGAAVQCHPARAMGAGAATAAAGMGRR